MLKSPMIWMYVTKRKKNMTECEELPEPRRASWALWTLCEQQSKQKTEDKPHAWVGVSSETYALGDANIDSCLVGGCERLLEVMYTHLDFIRNY